VIVAAKVPRAPSARCRAAGLLLAAAGWGCAGGAAGVGVGDGDRMTAHPELSFVEGVARAAEADSFAQLVQKEPGCAAAEGPGLDAAGLNVAGLGDGDAATAAATPGAGQPVRDIDGWAALVDPFLQGGPTIELVREGPLPPDAEVAGRPSCTGLAGTQLVIEAPGRRLRHVVATAAVRADLAAGAAAVLAGKGPEARVAFASAAKKQSPAVAGPGLAIAHSYAAEERWSEAVAAFGELRARWEWIASVHAGLGDVLRRAGRRGEAADAWSRAIALAPRATAFIRKVGSDPFVELRTPIAPPAARGADGRWTMRPLRARPGAPGVSPEAAAAAVVEAQAYASCKEAFRRSAPLQEAAVGQSLSPWRWSAAEESACTAVWLRAYQRNRDTGRPEDDGLDDLMVIAKAGFLGERSLFDVGALAHPWAPALLDDQQRSRLFAFVAAHRVIHRRQGGWLF
jgi:hypothetical protein